MDFFAWAMLLVFGAYVVSKYYTVQVTVETNAKNKQGAPPGVNFFSNTAVTHRPQQLQAFLAENPCSTQPPNTAPAFGPNENQSTPVTTLEV